MTNVLAGRHLRRLLPPIAALLSVLLTACSAGVEMPGYYKYLRITIGDFQTLGISQSDQMVRGVVVYFHDAGDSEFTMTSEGPQSAVTTDLIRSGFAIISAGFQRERYGDDSLVNSYLELGAAASNHYGSDNLYLLSDGMGAIPAFQLLAGVGQAKRVRGIVAINPVLELGTVPPEYLKYVAEGYSAADPAANSMVQPPPAFRGRVISFIVDPANTRSVSQVTAFDNRFGSDADITVTKCSSSDGNGGCHPGEAIVKSFTAMERRT